MPTPKKETKTELKPTAKSVAKKPAKKITKKVRKKPAPKITDDQFEAWFMKRSAGQFQAFVTGWNEKNLRIKLTNQKDYDSWLNYFKTIPARKLQILATTGMDVLDAEAYAALLRWRDIIANPHRIDKIHQAGLTNYGNKPKDHKTIVELALANDRLGVLKATRDQIAEKLEKGAGARDTAALAREMTEIMTQISDYEKRSGPKKTTKLGMLLDDMHEPKARNKSSGARNTSFKSRITIEDVEKV